MHTETGNKAVVGGLIVVLLLAGVAVSAPLLAPGDPGRQNLVLNLIKPCWEYPFGTDELGRCIFSRVVYGTRVSLTIGVVVTAISGLIGVFTGLIAGYFGGLLDEILMRTVDVLLAFPGLVLALVLAGLLGPGLPNVILALALVGWMGYARVVRGAVMAVKVKEFVAGVRALGAGDWYILVRHILPNVLAPVIVMATLGIGHVILNAAALSFLGLGVQPPTPEWGAMLNGGRSYLRTAPHLTVFPGLAIMVTVLGFNFLGDGLRDVLDPRSQAKIPD
ncbi:MAG: ABC transporter permease [Heliobacteriaceae bacterium]|nr:ABC transporter permease [Heliobacteriaceae bacterium]MDD4588466.1 ABC transporter permease [Heliobacteriaceae bacterium]